MWSANNLQRLSSIVRPKLPSSTTAIAWSASDRILLEAQPATTISVATYISRAHPKAKVEYAIPSAVQLVLDEVETRKIKRERKWDRSRDSRKKKGIPDDGGPFRNQNETIEFAVNLNVDPRKPGQSLRGSISLPNGTGKKVACVVFTGSKDLQERAKQEGALHAGGEELVDRIVSGEVSVDSFQRALATQDILSVVSKKAARLLGPRGLMPNPKVGTVLNDHEQLMQALSSQLLGKELQYRTEKEGIIHVPVGKGSFGLDNLLENISVVLSEIYENKPETYGKKRKGASGGIRKDKYVISAYVGSTFGKSFRVDLRTLDPANVLFMKEID